MPRYNDIEEIETNMSGAGLRVGIVLSRFNADIGDALLASCTTELRRLGVAPADITIVTVPGALESPLTLQALAQTSKYDALIALGAVVRGETYHFEVVSNEAASGITAVQLDTGVPVANGILTTENDEQAHARTTQKGTDCAQAAVEMANLLRRIRA